MPIDDTEETTGEEFINASNNISELIDYESKNHVKRHYVILKIL